MSFISWEEFTEDRVPVKADTGGNLHGEGFPVGGYQSGLLNVVRSLSISARAARLCLRPSFHTKKPVAWSLWAIHVIPDKTESAGGLSVACAELVGGRIYDALNLDYIFYVALTIEILLLMLTGQCLKREQGLKSLPINGDSKAQPSAPLSPD